MIRFWNPTSYARPRYVRPAAEFLKVRSSSPFLSLVWIFALASLGWWQCTASFPNFPWQGKDFYSLGRVHPILWTFSRFNYAQEDGTRFQQQHLPSPVSCLISDITITAVIVGQGKHREGLEDTTSDEHTEKDNLPRANLVLNFFGLSVTDPFEMFLLVRFRAKIMTK